MIFRAFLSLGPVSYTHLDVYKRQNVYVPTFMRSQTIVQELSSKYEVYVSNGSACAKGKKSHVLAAMHLSEEIADKSIRISFSRVNTKQYCEICAAAIKDCLLYTSY